MSLLLDVPYKEKDKAKQLGAKWNVNLKKWYVESKNDYYKFEKWILSDKNEDANVIICDYLYIVEGVKECFKCHKRTKVIGFGIENYFHIFKEDNEKTYMEYESKEIHIASDLEALPKQFYKYLEEKYNYHMGHSRYYANHCNHCDALQGNFFLFDEIDSPFFIYSISKAQGIKLYKIKLEYDFVASIDISYGSEDYLIEKYSSIIDLKTNIKF